MTDKKYTIKIDWTDEVRDYLEVEPDVASKEAVVERVGEGNSVLRVGQWAVSGNLLGVIPDGIMPAHKPLLNTAIASNVRGMVAEQKKPVIMNEKEVMIRKYIGPVGSNGGDVSGDGAMEHQVADALDLHPERYVLAESPAGLSRAIRYLFNEVPGHIYNRLTIIGHHGGDIRGYADQLKGRIDEIVAGLE